MYGEHRKGYSEYFFVGKARVLQSRVRKDELSGGHYYKLILEHLKLAVWFFNGKAVQISIFANETVYLSLKRKIIMGYLCSP